MPFDHNDHYHRLLLRNLPPGCRRALDVGCGTGSFARRLASRGIEVEALDRCSEVIRQACAAGTDTVRFRQADITTATLPEAHYDVISCLASLHHEPFETVLSLRRALAPGGALLVLGCYREKWPGDIPTSLIAVPTNTLARIAVAARDLPCRRRPAKRAPTKPPDMTLTEIRREAAAFLPGCTVRRLLFWRYLLVYRAPRQ